MKMEEIIKKKLTENLNLKFLEIKNNSHLHKGHAGDNGTMETHFAVIIESEELKGLSRVKAHQKVNKILKEEFTKGLHALEIKVIN